MTTLHMFQWVRAVTETLRRASVAALTMDLSSMVSAFLSHHATTRIREA